MRAVAFGLSVVGVVAFWVYILALGSYDYRGGFLVAPAIALIAAMLLPKMSGGVRSLTILLALALAARLGSALVRFFVSFGYYSDGFVNGLGGTIRGGYDAGRYHRAGGDFADSFRALDFETIANGLNFGTDFVEVFTGAVYAVIGQTVIGGFLVFATLAYLGSYFAYRAFVTAFPNENRTLFAVLIFFYPSILYWANGIGKDSIMLLATGLAIYGASLLINKGKWQGAIPLGIGVLGAIWVRPHIAGIMVLSLAVAMLWRAMRHARSNPLLAAVGLLVTVAIGWFFLNLATSFVGITELSVDAVLNTLASRQTSTFGGGSAFTPASITDPLGIPTAIITTLFRPFPFEASGSILLFVQASDGVILLGLTVARTKGIYRGLRMMGSNPYIAFIVIYVILMAIAFTAISNFGTLARQRAMVLPIFMMLLAIRTAPLKEPEGASEEESATDDAAPAGDESMQEGRRRYA